MISYLSQLQPIIHLPILILNRDSDDTATSCQIPDCLAASKRRPIRPQHLAHPTRPSQLAARAAELAPKEGAPRETRNDVYDLIDPSSPPE